MMPSVPGRVAQREAEIQPDRVLDDLVREAMAAVAERGHADTLPNRPLTPDPVSVTMRAPSFGTALTCRERHRKRSQVRS